MIYISGENATIKWGVSLFGKEGATAANLVGSTSGVVTLVLAAIQLGSALLEKRQDNVEYSDTLYKILDSMDNITNLYNTQEEREKLINTAVNMTKDKNLDPEAILLDLGGLMQTGDFASNEEALAFDATLREFLHNNGKSIDQVNQLMPQIITAMQMGVNVDKIFDDNDINLDSLEIMDVDGQGGMSGLDLQTTLLNKANNERINEDFGELIFSENDRESIEEAKNALIDRIVNADYNGPLNPEEIKAWSKLNEAVKYVTDFVVYKEVNGEPILREPWQEYPTDFKAGTDKYNKLVEKELKKYNKALLKQESEPIYKENPSESDVIEYQKRQVERRGENAYVATNVSQDGVERGQLVQNIGAVDAEGLAENQIQDSSVVGLSEEDLSLLYDINSNVSAIYGAMGLNNSQVVAEASDGYNSWTATTEMISNISNELSYNKVFQKNSVNHFIGISRDFDSVFSELYAMKGQLVSLLNEQKSAKDTLDTLSKRENNCLGWVTDLGSTSRIVSTV